jgi:DNA polymerase-1
MVADDGKLYSSFNPCGTVTGRPSSRKPNFLNITRTERNIVPAIRTLFKPSPGNVIIQGDYSQAELRCIAKKSSDPGLLAIYRDSNRSLHKETATAFYGADYTKEQYVKSKNINFGVCYGQSAFAFAQMYHMPREEAQAYIDAWFKKFPKVKEWIEDTKKIIFNENYVQNPFGRKRRFHLITEENMEACFREGINFLPQSTSSEFTEAAVVTLNGMGVPIISTVYDSIIADVPQDEAMDVALLMKQVMEATPVETIGWDDIPFTVDISVSEISWGDVTELEFEKVA